jgi:hypothetical protein
MTHLNSFRSRKSLAMSKNVINVRALCRTAHIKVNYLKISVSNSVWIVPN